jgi:lipopolysaccharide biosynthesis regulator YciM
LDQALYFYESAQDWLPAKLALASLFKKIKSWDKAIGLWEQLTERNSPFLADVYTELAKGYEHHHKDNEKALFYADKAYDSWKSMHKKNPKDKASYFKRIERLERKCMY